VITQSTHDILTFNLNVYIDILYLLNNQSFYDPNLSVNSLLFLSFLYVQAHFIKDRRCNTARAIFELESEYKWALSGTPLQNRVGELYSLVCNKYLNKQNITHSRLFVLICCFCRFASCKSFPIQTISARTVIVRY
jgi:hypothetical protein